MTKVKQAELFADSARGIYIPQHFAESANREKFKYIDKEQWGILESGPEADHYWDAWDEVLNNAETDCGGVLHQDGDLWIVWPQNSIDAVNDLCASQEEYETSHKDSGENYAHLVGESWCNQKTRDMVQSFNEEKRDHSVPDHFAKDSYKPQWQLLGIDKRWKDIEPDTLADMALESFDMVPGSMWGPYGNDCIVLDSFAVGEIEVPLDHLGIDAITMDLIRESCDAYISGNDYAYIATDSVWFAVVNVEALNIEIEQYTDSMES
jgi:hypothetical protein